MSQPRRIMPLPLGGEHGLPYSRGLMARALMAVGVAPDRAYALARRVGDDLASRVSDVVELDRLESHAIDSLGEVEGREALRQLRRCQDLRELDRPIVILVGGATGTGKSTVATEIAYRLGITRVTSTDFIRQTMRAFFADGVNVTRALVLFVKATHRECDNTVCRMVSFTYGTGWPALWSHANLDDATHDWVRGEFAEVPFTFFAQMDRSIRAGHLVPVRR